MKMTMPRVLGFDPGLKGACVLIDTDACTLACEPMPTIQVKRSGKWKTIIDEEGLALLVLRWDPVVGWIEDVYSRGSGPTGDQRREGIVGAFTFGEGKGILKGVLAGCRVPRRYVSPQRWKGDLNVGTEGILITARCNKLLPQCAKLLKSEGKREAAMITLWGCLSMELTIGVLVPAGSDQQTICRPGRVVPGSDYLQSSSR